MSEFLNFKEISTVPFKDVLDWLNIPYTVHNGELRGEGFIVDTAKNLYFNPKGTDKGSVINFVSTKKETDLRTCAKIIKDNFLTAIKEPVRELPNLELHYCKFLEEKGITEEMAKELEIGLVKQHSIISGRIAFKTYNEIGKHSGYVAYNIQKDDWFFPKSFKRTLYNPKKCGGNVILTVDIFSTLDFLKRGRESVALIGKTMTLTQEEQLAKFPQVLLIHPEPDNIVVRLSKLTYVRSSA